MYYQPEIETIKRSELQKLQVKRLKRSIDIALHSPFYAKILGEKGITSDSISTVEDIRKLPFTTKADLRVFVNGTNLFAVDNVDGYDSERIGGYPAVRTVSLGANIQF